LADWQILQILDQSCATWVSVDPTRAESRSLIRAVEARAAIIGPRRSDQIRRHQRPPAGAMHEFPGLAR
jgi:hypothetical protein